MSHWLKVTKTDPCPACGKPDWCAWTPDGKKLRCMRGGPPPPAMRILKNDSGGGTLYSADNEKRNLKQIPRPRSKNAAHGNSASTDLLKILKRLQAKLTDQRLTELAEVTGIAKTAWAQLAPGWCNEDDLKKMHAGGSGWRENPPTGAWCFPEYDGQGLLVGFSLRTSDGRKGSPAGTIGAKRGLTVPKGLHDHDGPVLLVEGASDVAACCAVGITAVGRPSNRAGAKDLATLLEGREVLVIGERDGKPTGAWPGRDGAKAIAQQIAVRWSEPVSWTLPPTGSKDIRDWVKTHPQGPAKVLLDALQAEAKVIKPRKRSTADELVDLASKQYQLGVSETGDAFAVDMNGPHLALSLRGESASLRAKLSKQYRELTGKTPNASALSDALIALEGMAMDSAPQPVALRLTEHDNSIVVDLGDTEGHAAIIEPHGWHVENSSPVLFRRTALTGKIPVPIDGIDPGALNELRRLLNVAEDSWPLVVGFLVAALIPNIPHPVLMLGGEQGTGKSTAARLMVGLVDPSPAILRSEPRNSDEWAISANGAWCIVIDNISRIPGWLSDAICKAVTGDGWVRRKLYTNSELSVLTFRRVVVMTSIDAGALRGDLGDRMILIDLEKIDEDKRQTEKDLENLYLQAHPRLLGALFSAAARVLATLPDINLETKPRMADFALVLAALDKCCPELTGGHALQLFKGQRGRIATDVVDGDPVATAVLTLIEEHGVWSGTWGDLLKKITPHTDDGKPRPPRGWPRTPRNLQGRIQRILPAVRELGLRVEIPPTRTSRGRVIRIEKARLEQSLSSQAASDTAETEANPLTPVTVEPKPSLPLPQPSLLQITSHKPQSPPTDGNDAGDGVPRKNSDRRSLIL